MLRKDEILFLSPESGKVALPTWKMMLSRSLASDVNRAKVFMDQFLPKILLNSHCEHRAQ